ncbi:MAG: type II toxin-antitoxin system VapC family toxin [Thiolinea sp.]
MAYQYLLDTNIISDLVKHPQGRVYEKIRQAGEAAICTSIIVAAELRFGAAKKGSSALTERIGNLLERTTVLAFDAPADQTYGLIRQQLQQQGQPIGPNDLLIAAHALSFGLVLVSHNLSEFQRVPGLRVEDWLAQ